MSCVMTSVSSSQQHQRHNYNLHRHYTISTFTTSTTRPVAWFSARRVKLTNPLRVYSLRTPARANSAPTFFFLILFYFSYFFYMLLLYTTSSDFYPTNCCYPCQFDAHNSLFLILFTAPCSRQGHHGPRSYTRVLPTIAARSR